MNEPKYKIGDKVWLMHANKPMEMELFNIVTAKEGIWYGLTGDFGMKRNLLREGKFNKPTTK